MSKLSKLIFRPRQFFADKNKKKTLPAAGKPPSKPPQSKPVSLAGPTLLVPPASVMSLYRVVLHTGEGKDGLSHIAMWVPHLIESGVPFYVMTRDLELYNLACKTFINVHFCYAKGPMEVERAILMQPTLRAVMYPSNTGNNIHFLRFNHLTHVFLGHGDSDKSGSAHKFFRAYDEVWVAGQAHHDRFVNAGFDISGMEFCEVGRPGSRPALRSTSNAARAADLAKPATVNFLYLPTWEGVYAEQDYSSTALANQILTRVAKIGSTVAVKFHPVMGKRAVHLKNLDAKIQSELGVLGLDAQVSVIERMAPLQSAILRANAYICDISAVVTECLAGQGPIFVYIPNDRPIITSQSKMGYQDFAYTFSSVDELIEKIALVAAKGDTLKKARADALEYLLGAKATLEQAFEKNVQRFAK